MKVLSIITGISLLSAAAFSFLYFQEAKKNDELVATMRERELQHLNLRSEIIKIVSDIEPDTQIDSDYIYLTLHEILDDDIKYF